MEKWKDITGYEGLYKVSDQGRITGQKGNILKQSINTNGYPYVNLCDNQHKRQNTRVHRVVAMEFVDNPNNLNVVNHVDGVKANNNANNLQWCTPSQNLKHAYQTGLSGRMGQYKPVEKVCIETGEVLHTYQSMSDAGRSLGFEEWKDVKNAVSNIKRNIRGGRTSAYGYKWRFVDEE